MKIKKTYRKKCIKVALAFDLCLDPDLVSHSKCKSEPRGVESLYEEKK
jgi:hypothetical protein